jgi:hypothetical protein
MIGSSVGFRFAMTTGIVASILASCAPRARMCIATSECPAESACVAGRCQLDKPSVRPALENASRWIVRPSDVAFVSNDHTSDGSLPPAFVLNAHGSSVLLLRFAVSLPKNATVVEAYIVLHRAEAIDIDPEPILLHTARIVEPWVGRSVSWGRLPRIEDTRAPEARLEPSGPSLVRLDVRDLVRGWERRDPADQGIAVVADNASRTGAAFAFRSSGIDSAGVSKDVEPHLELYIRGTTP